MRRKYDVVHGKWVAVGGKYAENKRQVSLASKEQVGGAASRKIAVILGIRQAETVN